MLNQETKRKIDTARQILVGKVPDPKAQVEQITTALIYKFMDDMDKEAVELGGKPRFFTNGFEKYAWSNVMDPKIGGQDRLELYGEAIVKMSRNPHIPQLFRDIFKDAFLPYRSPETLSLFLKELNSFTYDHSEDLGDAFEYLLSIMGSQGDAGQFRTPRHIIDFIAEVIDPKKDETILDPACGTAGFLISAYKHILKENKNKPLNTDEKSRLMNNLIGYDISPDMVKLSKVNMYLHGFVEPKIYEYDTLSSEEKWDEMYDVIMANPPFMSPKGGIRPHKRFSVQANRAEVLFVDYIKEHLRPTGRAGVIVPEGIVFQSTGAYKQLRKILVEDGLFAVASLPQGVFNPYSNVKTSILFFDNSLAKKAPEILFVKINNDGLDLGSQRKEIKENDLPLAEQVIKKFAESIRNGKAFILNNDEKNISQLVDKKKIVDSGDYNLNGERYQEKNISNSRAKNKFIKLGDIFERQNIKAGAQYKNYEVYTISSAMGGFVPQREYYSKDIASGDRSNYKIVKNGWYGYRPPGLDIGTIGFNNTGEEFVVSPLYEIFSIKENQGFSDEFLFLMMRSEEFKNIVKPLMQGSARPLVNWNTFKEIQIPLPELEIQKEIVSEITKKQAVIKDARSLIEKVERERANSGQIFERLKCKKVKVSEIAQINPKKSEISKLSNDLKVSFVPMSKVNELRMDFNTDEARLKSEVVKGYTYFKDGDILLAKITPCFENGKSGIVKNMKNGIGFGSTEFIVIRPGEKVLPEWLYYQVTNNKFIDEGKKFMTGSAGQKRLPASFLEKFEIPLPELQEQKDIVERFNGMLYSIEANNVLINVFYEQIKDRIKEVWHD